MRHSLFVIYLFTCVCVQMVIGLMLSNDVSCWTVLAALMKLTYASKFYDSWNADKSSPDDSCCQVPIPRVILHAQQLAISADNVIKAHIIHVIYSYTLQWASKLTYSFIDLKTISQEMKSGPPVGRLCQSKVSFKSEELSIRSTFL